MKRVLALILALVLLGAASCAGAAAPDPADRAMASLAQDGAVLNREMAASAGSSFADWIALSCARLGRKDGYAAYLRQLTRCVTEAYAQPERFSPVKATEWHRLTLVCLACGGDPTDVAGVDLLADGTFCWAGSMDLGGQGVNGWAWALIAMDAAGSGMPENAVYTRQDALAALLAAQNQDGGFSLTAQAAASDADITAMVLQALAPYYNDPDGAVRQAVDRALTFLSEGQTSFGDLTSGGARTLESTAQTVIALCALGLDPETEPRFVKNGVSVYRAMLAYQLEDGSFAHEAAEDAPDRAADSVSTYQALTALAAVRRLREGQRRLFDFRTEMDSALRESVDALSAALRELDAGDRAAAESLYARYLALPETERSYVTGFSALAAALKDFGIARSDRSLADALNEQPYGGTPWAGPEEQAGGVPAWIWACAGAVLLAAGTAAVLCRRRKRAA